MRGGTTDRVKRTNTARVIRGAGQGDEAALKGTGRNWMKLAREKAWGVRAAMKALGLKSRAAPRRRRAWQWRAHISQSLPRCTEKQILVRRSVKRHGSIALQVCTWHAPSSLVRCCCPQPARKQGARPLLQKSQAGCGQKVAKAGGRRCGALQAGAWGHVRVALHLERGQQPMA